MPSPRQVQSSFKIPEGVIPAVIGGGVSLLSQLWQNRREDSAHQREMEDLRKAGLNPALAAAGQGSQTGQVDLVGSALQLARAKAEIDLIKSQAGLAQGQDLKARTEAAEIQQFSTGRGDLVQAQIAVQRLNAEQLRQQMPMILERALEDIRLTRANVNIARVEGLLREAQLQGRLNEEELQKLIGDFPPWVRLFIQGLSRIR